MTRRKEVTSLVISLIIGIIVTILVSQIPVINELVKGNNKVNPDSLKPYAVEIVNGRDTTTWESDGITGSYRMEKEYLVAKVENEGYGIEAFYPYQLEEEDEGIYTVEVNFDDVKYRNFQSKPQSIEMVLLLILMGMVLALLLHSAIYIIPYRVNSNKQN